MREPSSGNWIRSGVLSDAGSIHLPGESVATARVIWRWSRPARHGALLSNGVCNRPERAKASNRIGAATARPTMPGTGAPSGRPTQTPMVICPSKPTAQASRSRKLVPVLKAMRL